MNTTGQRFPFIVHTYFWIVFSLLGLLPVLLLFEISGRAAVPAAWWTACLAWPVLVAILYWYGLRRCSSDTLRFRDGLLWITWSMITGWSTLSFCTVPPALLTAFLGSVLMALYGYLRRRPDYAPAQFTRMVAFFYRNRMRR